MAAKKSVNKKKSTKKKSSNVSRVHSRSNSEKMLMENFVALQKIMVDLSSNFEILNKKLTSLLTLFEDSAKTLVKRDLDFGKKDDEEAMKKLDTLLEQNKLIAKGLTLMHDVASGSYGSGPKVMTSGGYSPGLGGGKSFGVKKPEGVQDPEIKKPSPTNPSTKEEEELPFKVPRMPSPNDFPVR